MIGRLLYFVLLGTQTAFASTHGGETTAEEASPLLEIKKGPAIDLATAIATADRRNLSLKAARQDLEKAQADLKKAWSAIHPRASGNLTLTHNDHADVAQLGPGQEVEIRAQDTVQGQLLVNMTLLNPRAWLGVGVADQATEVATWSLEQVRQATLFNVAYAYFAALTARSLIDVQRAQLEASERHLTIASLRHRSGTGSRLDVIRAENDYVVAREDLLIAHTALTNARDALARFLGSEELPMPVAVESIPTPRASVTELTARAVQEREDVKLVRENVVLADRQLLASWMSFLPTLDAAWQLNQAITEPTGLGAKEKTRWFLGLTLTVPLYDYSRYGDLDRGRATLNQASLAAEDKEQEVKLEVRQAHRDWREAQELVVTADERAQLAREALRLAETAYETGVGNSLDVTDARRTLRQAEITLATRRFDNQLARLTLLRRSGADMAELASGLQSSGAKGGEV